MVKIKFEINTLTELELLMY